MPQDQPTQEQIDRANTILGEREVFSMNSHAQTTIESMVNAIEHLRRQAWNTPNVRKARERKNWKESKAWGEYLKISKLETEAKEAFTILKVANESTHEKAQSVGIDQSGIIEEIWQELAQESFEGLGLATFWSDQYWEIYQASQDVTLDDIDKAIRLAQGWY